MDKRMTSGEIAKKAGISQKAVRLYDEKGLLKPSEYSEGNYRLYDREALLVLENIIALKRIGFSLEEIRDNLNVENNIDIKGALNRQLELMERRKAEIDRTIGCIRGVLARTEGEPDWNAVAEIARMIQIDQASDESYYHSRKHNAENGEWYVRVYDSLNLKAGSCVLDLGCGFAKIWRNSWRRIPQDGPIILQISSSVRRTIWHRGQRCICTGWILRRMLFGARLKRACMTMWLPIIL